MSTVLVTGATDGLGRALAHAPGGRGRHRRRPCAQRGARPRGARRSARRAGRRAARRGRPVVAEGRARARRPGARPPRRARQQRRHRLPRPTRRGEDGYELRFAVNYPAGFLLASLLRDRLIASAPARIVNVASAGQQAIDFDDVMLERGYDGARADRQSKLAQIMHAFDLAEELAGSGVTAMALRPATFMDTKMVIDAGLTPLCRLRELSPRLVGV